MKITGNSILITGGGSGIGPRPAGASPQLRKKPIPPGRRKQLLDETTAANPGMASAILNIEDAASVRAFAAKLVADFPGLNVVINNAGIMRPENLLTQT